MGCVILGSLFVAILTYFVASEYGQLFRDAAPLFLLQGGCAGAPWTSWTTLRSHATASPFTSQFGACVRPRTPSSASARRLDWGSGARCGVRDCFDSSSTRG